MQIYVSLGNHKFITLEVEPTDLIGDLKNIIEEKVDTCIDVDQLIFEGKILDNSTTLQDNSITKDSTLFFRDDFDHNPSLNANRALLHLARKKYPIHDYRGFYYLHIEENKKKGSAYPACKAYINAILRINGSRDPPSLDECYQVANYNNGKRCDPVRSIELLEDHFHYGISCEVTDNLKIRDALTIPVIIEYSTSKIGWRKIKKDHVLSEKQEGQEDGIDLAIIDDYDTRNDDMICTTSRGKHLILRKGAAHRIKYILVHIKSNDIIDLYVPNGIRFVGRFHNQPIDCVWMNENEALYSNDYVFFLLPRKEQRPFLGYEINQFIYILRNLGH